jgi:hypothetical protein
MTLEDARTTLENSEELKPWIDQRGATVQYIVGSEYGHYTDGYGFIVYPYSSMEPIDLTYVFVFTVSNNGEVRAESNPLDKAELQKLTNTNNGIG